MPKNGRFGEFLKTWSLRSNSVTRQVSFNRTKIGGKCQNTKNSNATFWVIFKQCAVIKSSAFLITSASPFYLGQQQKFVREVTDSFGLRTIFLLEKKAQWKIAMLKCKLLSHYYILLLMTFFTLCCPFFSQENGREVLKFLGLNVTQILTAFMATLNFAWRRSKYNIYYRQKGDSSGQALCPK